MLRTILVGVNGSRFSQSAIELGLQWSKRYGAMLVGIGIIDEPGITRPQPVPLGGSAFKAERDAKVLAAARHRTEQLLSDFAQRCAAESVSCKLLEEAGDPATQILEEAQRFDLVLLGQKTQYEEETAHASTHLQQMVKQASRPIVAVPAVLPTATETVVVAYDGSLQSARTLQSFQSLGLAAGRTVHVLSIDPDQVTAARRADRAVEFLRSHELNAQPQAVASRSAIGPEILAQAARLRADLLVMGAYGSGTIKEFFFGSVTRHVLENSPVPVLVDH